MYDTRNSHVARIHNDDGYVIGKSLNSNGDFYAAYKGKMYLDKTTHQHEVRTRIFLLVVRPGVLI